MLPDYACADGRSPSIDNLFAGREILLAACSRSMPQDFPQQMAALVDAYFSARIAEAAYCGILGSDEIISVVAVGGYGRGQLAPHSDLDVLILSSLESTDFLEKLSAFLFHPLWDLKFDVGHGVRSAKQNIELARSDFKVFASLLDLRFVAGSDEPFQELQAKFKKELVGSHGHEFCRTLWDRRSKVGVGMDSVVLEPDLKNGWGGLRDAQFIKWCAAVSGGFGPLNNDDLEALRHHENLLMHARCAVHLLRKRKQDKLILDLLPEAASLCGVRGYNPEKRGNDLLTLIHKAMIGIRSMGDALYRESFDCESRTFIEFGADKDLSSALSLFEQKGKSGHPLTREARRAVSSIVSGSGCEVGSCLRRLTGILKSECGWRASLEMLDSGLFKAFLPDFAKVSELVPYDGYHQYPPGRHSLLTVHKCCDIFRDEFSDGGNCVSAEDFDALLLAALFHDIGKGKRNHSERGAVIAEGILAKTNYSEKFKEDIIFLVRHHLLLVKGARSLDLSSMDALSGVAGTVGSARRLRMLFILSMADSMATGPRVWNSWSESLLRELYSGLERLLTDDSFSLKAGSDAVSDAVSQVLECLDVSFGPELAESMIAAMPERYLLLEDAPDIAQHMQLVKEFNKLYERDLIRKPSGRGGRGVSLVRAYETDEPSRVKLVIAARDQDFLFAAQSGVLALHSINILSAEIFSWSDGTALNIFIVDSLSDSAPADIWARVERSVMYAMTGRLSLDYRLHKKRSSLLQKAPSLRGPARISIDNNSSQNCTVIEVIAQDRAGLLYDMASLFSRMNVNLRMARISTTGQSVFDVFHVEGFEGGKIEDREHGKELVGALSCILE